jgi:hypothetical protein
MARGRLINSPLAPRHPRLPSAENQPRVRRIAGTRRAAQASDGRLRKVRLQTCARAQGTAISYLIEAREQEPLPQPDIRAAPTA